MSEQITVTLDRENAGKLARHAEHEVGCAIETLASAPCSCGVGAAIEALLVALDAQEVQPQALEPVGEEPCERCGHRRGDCDYCDGDGGYRVTSGRMVDGKPVEKTKWVTCVQCGGDKVVERDGDCKNVPCPSCQPEDERESTEGD